MEKDEKKTSADAEHEPTRDQEVMYRCKLALQRFWWQAEKPSGPSIRRELSAVKQWRGRVDDDELLIRALEMYRGNPIAFLWGHKGGNHHLLQRLLAKARQERGSETPSMTDAMRDFARGLLANS